VLFLSFQPCPEGVYPLCCSCHFSPALREFIHCVVLSFQPCSDGVPDFRNVQCSRFNNVSFNGKFYEWLAYHAGEHKHISLNCLVSSKKVTKSRTLLKILAGTLVQWTKSTLVIYFVI
jgi:hypothetical protein